MCVFPALPNRTFPVILPVSVGITDVRSGGSELQCDFSSVKDNFFITKCFVPSSQLLFLLILVRTYVGAPEFNSDFGVLSEPFLARPSLGPFGMKSSPPP